MDALVGEKRLRFRGSGFRHGQGYLRIGLIYVSWSDGRSRAETDLEGNGEKCAEVQRGVSIIMT